MRPTVLLAPILALACSGREPPGIRSLDAAAYPVPDGGGGTADVALADAPADRADVVMIPNGGMVPDFALQDLNPASRTYQRTVSPSALRPRVTAYYFANAI